MAYSLWLDRVQEVCKHGRLIAISHGLEELCQVPERTPGSQRSREGRRSR